MANEDSADIQLDRHNDIFRGDLAEYSELPRRFPLDLGVVDAIGLLRDTIHPSAQECGAILTKTAANELKTVSVGKPGQGIVEMSHLMLAIVVLCHLNVCIVVHVYRRLAGS